jgi:hypothetical protein
MANYFLDTSGLVRHYHAEVGSVKVDGLWADAAARLDISRLGVVETVSVAPSTSPPSTRRRRESRSAGG